MQSHRFVTLIRSLPLAALLAFSVAVADTESDGPEAIADRLHELIVAGDEQALTVLMDPELLVYESGGVESSLEEYASHHMGADMAFMAGMQREVLDRTVMPGAPVSVVSTRSRLSGEYNGRPMNLLSNETLVIRHGEHGPRIVHIHWSSADAR